MLTITSLPCSCIRWPSVFMSYVPGLLLDVVVIDMCASVMAALRVVENIDINSTAGCFPKLFPS
jgi:hypothetical protein